MGTLPQESYKSYSQYMQLLLIFSPLSKCLMLCFLSCGGKYIKVFNRYYLNHDYLTEFCVSQTLGLLSSPFSVVLSIKQIVSDVLKSDLLTSKDIAFWATLGIPLCKYLMFFQTGLNLDDYMNLQFFYSYTSC